MKIRDVLGFDELARIPTNWSGVPDLDCLQEHLGSCLTDMSIRDFELYMIARKLDEVSLGIKAILDLYEDRG